MPGRNLSAGHSFLKIFDLWFQGGCSLQHSWTCCRRDCRRIRSCVESTNVGDCAGRLDSEDQEVVVDVVVDADSILGLASDRPGDLERGADDAACESELSTVVGSVDGEVQSRLADGDDESILATAAVRQHPRIGSAEGLNFCATESTANPHCAGTV